MSTEREELAAMAQVIADSFFAMEAGESWEQGGYPRPTVNAGDMQLAFDLQAAGYRKQEPVSDAEQNDLPLTAWAKRITAAARAVTNGDNR